MRHRLKGTNRVTIRALQRIGISVTATRQDFRRVTTSGVRNIFIVDMVRRRIIKIFRVHLILNSMRLSNMRRTITLLQNDRLYLRLYRHMKRLLLLTNLVTRVRRVFRLVNTNGRRLVGNHRTARIVCRLNIITTTSRNTNKNNVNH